jgi:WD repeat and SOF domain-containing protein 1
MKVQAISRARDFTRERTSDIHKVSKNPDSILHPFERAREYSRALNHIKIEKLFAKPFLKALQAHADGVYCLAKHQTSIQTIYSASADGGQLLLTKRNKSMGIK